MANIPLLWADGAHGTSPVTVLSTELNSLANNNGALSAAIQNRTDRDLYADAELNVTFGVAPTADSVVEIYIARSVDDGGTYEDATGGASPILPRNGFIGNFVLRAVTSAQKIILPSILIPPRDFKTLVRNLSGQAFPASGSTVRFYFYREQLITG